MILAALLPLVWALTGLVAVARLSPDRGPRTRTVEGPRIDLDGSNDLRPAA